MTEEQTGAKTVESETVEDQINTIFKDAIYADKELITVRSTYGSLVAKVKGNFLATHSDDDDYAYALVKTADSLLLVSYDEQAQDDCIINYLKIDLFFDKGELISVMDTTKRCAIDPVQYKSVYEMLRGLGIYVVLAL